MCKEGGSCKNQPVEETKDWDDRKIQERPSIAPFILGAEDMSGREPERTSELNAPHASDRNKKGDSQRRRGNIAHDHSVRDKSRLRPGDGGVRSHGGVRTVNGSSMGGGQTDDCNANSNFKRRGEEDN